MNLLAIDTATEACSAALLQDDDIYERYQLAPREHNRMILPMISALLDEAGVEAGDLDAIAFGCGPGSFTGVRIAAGVTQGIAFGLELPVVPISTLAALSLDAMETTGIDVAYACIDARMNEVYWGIYERDCRGEISLVGEESVTAAATVNGLAGRAAVGTGSGWMTYSDVLPHRVGAYLSSVLPDRFPRAGSIARLGALTLLRGHGIPAEQAQPVYLRDNVARKSNERG